MLEKSMEEIKMKQMHLWCTYIITQMTKIDEGLTKCCALFNLRFFLKHALDPTNIKTLSL